MKRLFSIIAFLFLAVSPALSQYKMQVELNSGIITDYYVSEIKQIIWTYDNNEGGNDENEPTVTGDATDISNYTATITAWANNILDNLATDLEVGVIYTTEGTPSKNNGTKKTVKKSDIAPDGKYSVSLTNLSPATTYYYRSYVYQSGVYFYGKVRNFTTEGQGVTFNTGEATGVTCFSAKVSASVNVSSTTSYSKLAYGICYGSNPEPTISDGKVEASSRDTSGNFNVTLRALTGSTVYYYRPYASVDGYMSYGPVRTFQTIADNVVVTGDYDDETGTVTSRLTIGGGAYSTLTLGVCWNYSVAGTAPSVSDFTATANEVDDENLYIVPILVNFGTTNWRAYVLIDGVAHYGEIKSTYIETVYEYVDLGLSVKWATCNVGARNPEEYGDYFAWGDTKPYYQSGYAQENPQTHWNPDKTDGYGWSSYKYCKGGYDTMTKYCNKSSYGYNGFTDSKTVLDPEDDAAHVNWGRGWRMPTRYEFDELCNSSNCTWTWTTMNGVNGYKVVSKKSGYAGNYIFLPAAGCRYDTYLYGVGSCGYYWSSSLYAGSPYRAYYLYFDSGYYDTDYSNRNSGQSVRPVCH